MEENKYLQIQSEKKSRQPFFLGLNEIVYVQAGSLPQLVPKK